jgi:hypothetical protein
VEGALCELPLAQPTCLRLVGENSRATWLRAVSAEVPVGVRPRVRRRSFPSPAGVVTVNTATGRRGLERPLPPRQLQLIRCSICV